MKNRISIPTNTRRLRIAFDVDVKVQPLPDDVIEAEPGLAPFLEVILDDPDLRDRMLAFKAFHCLFENTDDFDTEDSQGRLSYSYLEVLLSAARKVSVDQATLFIIDELFAPNHLAYVTPLVELFQACPVNDLPQVIDLDSGETISWQEAPPTSVLYQSTDSDYLLIETRDGNILVLNLLFFPSTCEVLFDLDLIANNLGQLGLGVHRVLVILGGGEPDLIPDGKEAIQMRCDAVFPGLPVDIKVFTIGESGESEEDPCKQTS